MRLGGQNEGNKVALTKGASSRLGRGAVGNNSKPGCVSVRTLLTELFSPEVLRKRRPRRGQKTETNLAFPGLELLPVQLRAGGGSAGPGGARGHGCRACSRPPYQYKTA